MSEQNVGKLNKLARLLPEDLVADAAWLSAHGYSTSLRAKYLASGWLFQPAPRVYRRSQEQLSWQQVVISLQTILLRSPLVVGGRTALEVRGFAHFLKAAETEVHLYGSKPPPTWLHTLPLQVRFHYHSDRKLFRNDPVHFGIAGFQWGSRDRSLTLSTPERAILELLDELPDRETFHQADMLFEGLSSLRPRQLQKLLADCTNVKVKRLFFFFADRHRHAWLNHIERAAVDLGSGKRMLVKEGRLDPVYQITVPKELEEVH